MNELIVVVCHGSDWQEKCAESLAAFGHSDDTDTVFVQTGFGPGNIHIDGGWQTGALLHVRARPELAGYDRFLLMQDSMVAIADPLPWFRDQWVGAGAVAWQLFPMDWDSEEQRAMVENRYDSHPHLGIFGPIFYTDRESLCILDCAGLLPAPATNRVEGSATERAWAYAFAEAQLPVIGPLWNVGLMTTDGVPPFRKMWANRP